jgi:TolA-binding protein
MGFAHKAFVAAGVGFAAAVLVGCGSSGGSLLSGSQANNLTAQLNRVSDALNAQDCSQAQQYLQDFQSSVENMGGVNATLINDLDQGANTIQSLANRECHTVTTPKKTRTKTQTDTTTTATRTTQTFTNPVTTATYTQPTYTQPSDTTTSTTSTTTTTGGSCATCLPTTTTSSQTTTTNSNGGTGLGSGPDTSTGTDTTTTDTTGTSGF